VSMKPIYITISRLLLLLAVCLFATACDDPVSPGKPLEVIRLDSVSPIRLVSGQHATLYGHFPTESNDQYKVFFATGECSIISMDQAHIVVQPPRVYGSGFFSVTRRSDVKDSAFLSWRVWILYREQSSDTAVYDSLYPDLKRDLKVEHNGSTDYFHSFSINTNQNHINIDDIIVYIGPLIIKNTQSDSPLSVDGSRINVSSGSVALPPGRYPVVVEIRSTRYIAVGPNVTIKLAEIKPVVDNVRAGDTVCVLFDDPNVYAEYGATRFSRGYTAHAISYDSTNQCTRIGSLPELMTGNSFVSLYHYPTHHLVGRISITKIRDTIHSSSSLTWSPQQQYPGRRIEIYFPDLPFGFHPSAARVAGEPLFIESYTQRSCIAQLGPAVKDAGPLSVEFTAGVGSSKINLVSTTNFTPLLRATPVIPIRSVHGDLKIPGNWAGLVGNAYDTVSFAKTITLDLNYTCDESSFCDTLLTSTFIRYYDSTSSQSIDRSSMKVSVGFVRMDSNAPDHAIEFDSQYQSSNKTWGHNTNYDNSFRQIVHLVCNAPVQRNSDGTWSLHLVGQRAFDALVQIEYVSLQSSNHGATMNRFITLDPSIAHLAEVTLVFRP